MSNKSSINEISLSLECREMDTFDTQNDTIVTGLIFKTKKVIWVK